MLYPKNIEQKIGFDLVRELVKQYCVSELGKNQVDCVSFSSDFEVILKNLFETEELITLLRENNMNFPLTAFFDLRESIQNIRIEGTFLTETELFELKKSIETTTSIVKFLLKKSEKRFPHLEKIAKEVILLPEIVEKIDFILDKFGQVKDNASEKLQLIRQSLRAEQTSISRLINNILKKAQADGFVEKGVNPTMREGRLVIPVAPMFKRKIGGIIHDESATGKTVFIEPSAVIETNNRIRELENEERREIVQILTQITNHIRPFSSDIIENLHFLGKIDFLKAKSLFSIEIGAIKPNLKNESHIDWKKAKHPLLLLSLKRQNKEIVPLQISLNKSRRILLISGPNAGGKSVCLKTVALLQFMLQCGLPIPIHESSEAGIFSKIFIDIGDEQSIENDLSTYSSHLLNMKNFLKFSNSETLLLIDEFGSGTEPQIGGAIAESILNHLNKKQVFGVITTHYTNLKHFAAQTEGISNGAMLYDRHQMSPLFQLQIGNPGSSFAIEIAQKIGLPDEVIKEAAEKAGSELIDFDKYLQDIVRDKRYWENKRQQIRQKEKQSEELIERYEKELKELQQSRKELILKAKQSAEQLLNDANAKIESTIKTIKEAQADKELTKEVRNELKNYKEKILENNFEDKKITHKINEVKKHSKKKTSDKKANELLSIGNFVRIVGQQAIGEIVELKQNTATIVFGNIKTSLKTNRLEKVSRNQARKEIKNQNTILSKETEKNLREKKLNFKPEIDLRGLRADEALQQIVHFIDNALMVNVSRVRILHGTGTGALRQLTRDYLSGIKGITFHDEHVQFGGAGITVVEL
ncbi:MAG: Smr/MutS family protein [Paludibacteraceae bacterium]|nr:Smr/MutS family protein [Paludibacteraceae bacterium]